MKNYIVINGNKTELTEEQLKKLGIKLEKTKYEEMFERSLNTDYYFIDTFGGILVDRENNHAVDFAKDYFSVGNYCKDKEVMKQRALHETLNRLLWRASVIAGELDNEWMGCGYGHKHWHIEMYTNNEKFGVDYFEDTKYCDGIYFPTEQSALDAIENIVKPFLKEHPDFVW